MAAENHESRVYVFRDDTSDYDESLSQLLCTDNYHLNRFFRDAYAAIRTELGKLPLHTRDTTPKVSSLSDLMMRKRDGSISAALEQVLCLVHLFASFIEQHSDGKLPYPTPQDSRLLGVGVGTYAAAAISASDDMASVVPLATHAIVVALHAGLRADLEANSIQGSSSSGPWAISVAGTSSETLSRLVDRFNSTNSLPPSSCAYISAISKTAVTISGPPTVLLKVMDCHEIAGLQTTTLPIRSPRHAKHLFGDEDIELIMTKAAAMAPNHRGALIPVLSCGIGHSIWAESYQSLMNNAAHDNLSRQIILERAIEHLEDALKAENPPKVLIVPIGTDASKAIDSRLGVALDGIASVSVHFSNLTEKNEKPFGSNGKCKIAVIGMAGRFPGASGANELWDLLRRRVDMCKEVPPLRWNANTHVDQTGKAKNTSKVRWGCWIDEPDLFDAPFFGISPREAPQIDPAQRLALITAYEAMEHAGVVPGRTPSTREDRVGVFYGVTSNDWCEANSGQDIDVYYIPGANRAFIPGRVNYFFKFSGPSYAIDTACSSSLSAVHIACNSLWQGDIDMAIVGGTNVLTNPDMTTGLDKGHFLSTTGNCKTFDASADGYCRGEGVATVLLKRIDDAIQDDDTIHGIIGSAYTNHSAEAESITRPHVGAQIDVLERVLNDSGTHPHDVGYIEMHGTGTQAGDTREITSVCSVFAPLDESSRRPSSAPLHIGALKANIGHGESVSGVSALIKVIMMMKNNQIPPHCGIKTKLNPAFPRDLAERNVHIALEATPWTRGADNPPRKAIINNFSAAGGNSSILVEEAPSFSRPTAEQVENLRPVYPVAISAKSGTSLRHNIKALLDRLRDNQKPAASLPEISYTTTARRTHHPFRFVTTAADLDMLESKLATAVDEGTAIGKRIVPPKAILFSFTGQGSQYPGMGKHLYETLAVFRDHIAQFDRLARNLGFPAILPMFLASNGEDVSHYLPVVVQLANTCMQIALARIWISWGVKPSAVVGHSLGEYAALNIAGVLSDSDMVYLVGRRAQHLQNFCQPHSHAMLAVVASVTELQGLGLNHELEIACINGPKETVLAGTAAQIAEWDNAIKKAGIRTTPLKVPYAFHSSQVDPIVQNFINDATGVVFHEPQLPVLSPLEGKVIKKSQVFSPHYVGRHAREPVQMMKCLEAASADNTLPQTGSFGIEFGPHPVVSGMIKATLGSAVTVLPTLRRKTNPWETLTSSLSSLYAAGCPVDFNGYFEDLELARHVVELPRYSWDLKSYWISYRNDWTLTKGDIPVDCIDSPLIPANNSETEATPVVLPPATLESTTIHNVLEEIQTSEGVTILVDCDVSREDVNPFIRSHTVDGYSLCTPAVYADISFSLGTYVLDKYQPNSSDRVVSIRDVDITRALIGSADWKQRLRCTASFNWAAKCGKLRFTVHDSAGDEVGQLSTMELKFVDESLRHLTQDTLESFKANFERMQQSPKVSRFNGNMSYRLVSQLAEFNPDYHCIDDVLYDSDAYEAACHVSFGQMKKGGSFHINPAAVDGLTQSAGFVMNANNNTKLETEVFVNHGWKDFQLFERIRDDRQYSTHVKMMQGADNLWTGDIAIFEGDRAVGLVQSVQIQGLPRKFLKHVLSQAARAPKGKGKPARAVAASKPAAQPKAATNAAAPAPAPKLVTASAAPTPQPASNPAPLQDALKLISEESEIPVTDLRDDVKLSDVGIDSLVSLLIASRFTEELGITTDSAVFMEDATIADIKQFVHQNSPGSQSEEPVVAQQAEVQPASESAESSTTVAPFANSNHSQSWSAVEIPESGTPPAVNFDDVVKIIAEEVEIDTNSITDQTSLVELGVDSLLSLLIGSRLRDELDIEIDTSSLLTSLSNVGALKQALDPATSGSTTSSSSSTEFGQSSLVGETKDESLPTSPSEDGYEKISTPVPPTASVVLQGNPRSATSTLWFFPDGSGLASSYLFIPKIRNDLVVYGINSPYLKKGIEMNCTWDELIDSYIREIQRRQPEGPYSFAGWSAGGIGAFHAAQVLMNSGHVVRDLIILDSPPPFHLAPLPERFFRYCAMAGLFGGRDGQTPEWVINHFRNINNVLSKYIPKPLRVSTLRKVNILWACESSVDDRFERRPDDPEDMKFLTTKRTDFTPGRWGPLFGDVPVKVDRAEGEHHWSILKGDSAVKVAEFIRGVLA